MNELLCYAIDSGHVMLLAFLQQSLTQSIMEFWSSTLFNLFSNQWMTTGPALSWIAPFTAPQGSVLGPLLNTADLTHALHWEVAMYNYIRLATHLMQLRVYLIQKALWQKLMLSNQLQRNLSETVYWLQGTVKRWQKYDKVPMLRFIFLTCASIVGSAAVSSQPDQWSLLCQQWRYAGATIPQFNLNFKSQLFSHEWPDKMVADKMVRTKWYGLFGIRTKWYGQNGTDKVVRTEW